MAKHTKSCGVYTARFLKYVWPFYNTMHERVKHKKLYETLLSFSYSPAAGLVSVCWSETASASIP